MSRCGSVTGYHPRMRLVLPVILCVAASVAIPSSAAAQGGYVGVGLGPGVRLDDWPNQIVVEQEIGYFVSGEPRGFYIAFAPSQSWGNDWWVLVFPVRLGGTFDIFHNSDISVQLGGTGTLGFALSDQYNNGRDPDPWFHLSFALLGRLLLMNDRFAIYVRPVGFEFGIGDSRCCQDEGVRYVATAGIQYYFF